MASKRSATDRPSAPLFKKRKASIKLATTEDPNQEPSAITTKPSSMLNSKPTPEITPGRKTGSKHVRFDSVEPEDPNADEPDNEEPLQPNRHADTEEQYQEEAEEEREQDSEDEAPDAITTAAAHKTAKESLANAAKAVTTQRDEQKRRRKERDARLKAQSSSSSTAAKKKMKDNKAQEAVETAGQDDQELAHPLPDLLPPELLEEDFTRRPTPSPPPQPVTRASKNQTRASRVKTVFPSEESSRPKSRQVGRVRVSVLQKSSPLLPPKADPKVQSLRESWLSGRLSTATRKGAIGGERRLMNTGFLRP